MTAKKRTKIFFGLQLHTVEKTDFFDAMFFKLLRLKCSPNVNVK